MYETPNILKMDFEGGKVEEYKSTARFISLQKCILMYIRNKVVWNFGTMDDF